MEDSPITSPAFTIATQSSNNTSNQSIKFNAKSAIIDTKNLLLNRPESFKVQRRRYNALVAAYEIMFAKLRNTLKVISLILSQNQNPRAQELGAEVDAIFGPMEEKVLKYMRRAYAANERFLSLGFLEHKSHEMSERLEKLRKRQAAASDTNERAVLAEFHAQWQQEYNLFQINFRIIAQRFCTDVIITLARNIRALNILVARGCESMLSALDAVQNHGS